MPGASERGALCGDVMIAYLCDKKKDCAGSPSCGSLCNHTLDVSHAVNGPCADPRGNDRFKVVELGDDPKYMELDDVYNIGKPPAQGWYDCLDKDGQYHRLRFFQCNLNARKYYYTDLQGEVFGRPEDGIRWTGKASMTR